MTFLDCIALPTADEIRRHHMTPFGSIHFRTKPGEMIPDFDAMRRLTEPIDWLFYAKSIDRRFLICEAIMLCQGSKILGKLVELDPRAGRWVLAQFKKQVRINTSPLSHCAQDIELERAGVYLDNTVHQNLMMIIESALARAKAMDVLREIQDL